jgi:hypothetical protein|tara:strand:+ start:1188 stop:1670 length:483 start_codon:yes stop_codon:yes gene_type:complete
MAIKDTPKGQPDSALDFPRVIDDVGQEYDPTEPPRATLTKEDQEAVDTQDIVKYMEHKYPEMTTEFLTIQQEQYELFLRKQHDYGPQNVAVGSLLKTKEDIKLSLLGLWFRIQDKTERIKTLLMRDDGNSVQDEPVVDSFNDISVYGIMAQVVSRGKWAK